MSLDCSIAIVVAVRPVCGSIGAGVAIDSVSRRCHIGGEGAVSVSCNDWSGKYLPFVRNVIETVRDVKIQFVFVLKKVRHTQEQIEVGKRVNRENCFKVPVIASLANAKLPASATGETSHRSEKSTADLPNLTR